eukprot:gene5646-6516_t
MSTTTSTTTDDQQPQQQQHGETDIENLDFNVNIDDPTFIGIEEESGPPVLSKEYYLCLCYEHAEGEPNKIEAFHNELGDFCESIGHLIRSSDTPDLSILPDWYSICEKEGVYGLVSAVEGIETTSTPVLVRVDEQDGHYFVSVDNYRLTNGFCRKWSRRYLDHRMDSLLLRTLSSDIKLKVIQELNLFRRMVDSSKMNNYLLYKSHLFLGNNDNSDVLLDLLKKDNVDIEINEILSILSQQQQQQQQ